MYCQMFSVGFGFSRLPIRKNIVEWRDEAEATTPLVILFIVLD
jgi:hypothetical protein